MKKTVIFFALLFSVQGWAFSQADELTRCYGQTVDGEAIQIIEFNDSQRLVYQ